MFIGADNPVSFNRDAKINELDKSYLLKAFEEKRNKHTNMKTKQALLIKNSSSMLNEKALAYIKEP